MKIDELCLREVQELHSFFEEWFTGRLQQSATTFDRFKSVLADNFRLISPNGSIHTKNDLVILLQTRYNSETKISTNFAIWIKNYSFERITDSLFLTTYEEWQLRFDVITARISTALFILRPDLDCLPNQVQWLHVHETWLNIGKRELTSG